MPTLRFLLACVVRSTMFSACVFANDTYSNVLPEHGYVGLRPLPRSQAEAHLFGPQAKHIQLFDKNIKGQYPIVAEHLDVLKGQFSGDDFRTNRSFFEYYWGLNAKRDSLVPEESPLVQTIRRHEQSEQVVEHILICREYELFKNKPDYPNAKPGPFKEDTRILFAKDIDDIRMLFKKAHQQGLLKHDNYKLIQMVQDPSFFATDKRVFPIIRKLDGICFESHQFNVHWPLETGRSKPGPIALGAKWTLEQDKEYILYFGPIIWKSKDYVPFIERKWLEAFWKAGLPKRHPKMHYYLNLFPHAHGIGRPVGPESDPHSKLGFTKWLIQEIKDLPQEIPYGMVDVHDPDTQIPESVRPLFDTPIRDTQICRGPDGNYYMTGTTAHDGGSMGAWNAGIHVWKSKDLKSWEPLGLVVDLDKMDSWISKFYIWPKDYSEPGKVLAREELPEDPTDLLKTHQVRRCAWANEIHYIPSQKTFFIVGSMNHNVWVPPAHRIGHGLNGATFMLRSISGKAEGPYVDVQPDRPMTGEIDSSLFIDDDGTGYFVYQAHGIARIKKDFSGLAEQARETRFKPIQGVRHQEGAYLFKANGKYCYVTTSWSVEKEGSDLYTYDHSKGMKKKYSYDPLLAMSDNVYGPYGEMRNTLSGAGHGNFFQDRDGGWWACIFWNPGNQNNPPGLHSRPAIVAMKWTGDGSFVVDKQRTDEFYAD